MVLTKEHQEQMVNSYLKTHTVTETEAYIQGINDIIELINKQVNNKDINTEIYYQPDFENDDTLITPKGVELWSYSVYRSFENAQKDFPNRNILRYENDDIESPSFLD